VVGRRRSRRAGWFAPVADIHAEEKAVVAATILVGISRSLQNPAMQRFTISLDDELATQFDAFIAEKGYVSRSEAVRDLIRLRLGDVAPLTRAQDAKAKWCVANLSYVYDHHDQTVAMRVLDIQHQHHDLVVSSTRAHLDHHHCMETVVLRGSVKDVRALADQVVALRGVRHGQAHFILLDTDHKPHRHEHGGAPHTHWTPLN